MTGLASEPAARPLIVILSGVAVFTVGFVWSSLTYVPGTGVNFGPAALMTVGEIAVLVGIGIGIRAFIASRRHRRRRNNDSA
ncbi:hypothetical protein REH65_00900 [Saccharopolyspora sp. ID03-671]|uniref:hypothetical protein n=1 Tax=Saccharopolyspora sp. ID03-671 TaxID=3073066 RepID=UPI00324EC055